MIKVKEYYTFKNNPIAMQCVARYENGGVAVGHVKLYDGTPSISTYYLKDEDLAKGTVLGVSRPVRGYVNYIYNGDDDSKYLDPHVYTSETLARDVFSKQEKSNPYLRLIDILEVKP